MAGSTAPRCTNVAGSWTVDTNVLVYAFDLDEEHRRNVALELLDEKDRHDIRLPRQTIGEFFHAAIRTHHLNREGAARNAQRFLAAHETFVASADAYAKAIEEAATGNTQIWDALIVAACADNGIDLLLTEDMAEGRYRLGVEIVNPFKPGPGGRKALKKRGIAAR
jgi:predicted nucleic acid-binding protein